MIYTHHSHPTVVGTILGTLLTIINLPSTADIEHSIILAVIGASAGYVTTILLKKLITWFKHHFNKHKRSTHGKGHN